MTKPVIEATGISKCFTFGDNVVEAVHPCDVAIPAGELIVIVGKSGSGKSTLCNVLSGVDSPTTGTVALLGRQISELSDRELARLRATELGFVLQQDNLVPWLNIEENVAAPLIFAGEQRKTAIAKARDYLERVGIAHRASSWPALVSGGEAQRAAVARACIADPAVVFADEPTGALDEANSLAVQELFWDLVRSQNTAAVVVSHDADLAEGADRVLTMVDGRLQSTAKDRNRPLIAARSSR